MRCASRLPCSRKEKCYAVPATQLQKKKPGYNHYEKAYYEGQFGGPLETNGFLAKGHRAWVLDGTDGVLVPDAPVTKIRMCEELEAALEFEVGGSGQGDSEEAAWFINLVSCRFIMCVCFLAFIVLL